ncbi:MAG: HNH endonuclease [Elusimicrobia bacterium]|nr:HNH endonuclease [Elusimicrobiota bacterium]
MIVMGQIEECRSLSDQDLSRNLKFLASRDSHAMARMLVHLAEFDRRGLCLKEGGESLFAYCTRMLGYDEFDAFRRIRAARTINKYPSVLSLIESGKISITAIAVLHPYLTPENHKAWFAEVAGKSRREIEALIAARHPQGARPDLTRRHPPYAPQFAPSAPPHALEAASARPDSPTVVVPPDPSASPPDSALEIPADAPPSRPWEWQAVVPVAMDRVRIGFDAGISVLRLIDRARQVLRHKYPAGRLEDVMHDALEIFLDRKDPQRKFGLKPVPVVRDAALPPPREPRFLRDMKAGRYIPMKVKSAVWQRDGGRCAWRFEDGTVCGSKDSLEYDHVRPFAKGGRSDSPRNVRLLCRNHNREAAAAAGLSVPASS